MNQKHKLPYELLTNEGKPIDTGIHRNAIRIVTVCRIACYDAVYAHLISRQ